MVSLLRFAIKATQKVEVQAVPDKGVTSTYVDISKALEVMRSEPGLEGLPAGIDEVPSPLDYPSVDLTRTGWLAYSDTQAQEIKNSPWKILVLRATSVSPYSDPRNFTLNDQSTGWNGINRPRVIGACWPDPLSGEPVYGEWELDALNKDQRASLYLSLIKNVILGFDLTPALNWLGNEIEKITGEMVTMPDRVIDLGLVGRVLRPSLPMELQVKAANDAAAQNIVAKGGSGWSLEAFATVVCEWSAIDFSQTFGRMWCAPAPLENEVREEIRSLCKLIFKTMDKLMGPSETKDLLDRWDDCVMARSQADVSTLHYMQHYPQVLSLMHLKGMPFNLKASEEYVAKLKVELTELVTEMVKDSPELMEYEEDLADPERGLSEKLKQTLGSIFEARGLKLEYTKGRSRLPKIGEKELRGAGASQNESTAKLFLLLVRIGKVKRQIEMAQNLAKFAGRSETQRLHSVFAPSTGTLRLSSVEPNAQQFPGVQEFRNQIEADDGHKIVAFDYSALDVRNGAALAIRSQRLWVQALQTGKLHLLTKDTGMMKALDEALSSQNPQVELIALERNMHRVLEKARTSGRWDEYEHAQKRRLAHKAAAVWLTIVPKTKGSADGCWGGLREAFQLNADVHSYTGLRFNGEDPKALIKRDLGENPDKSSLAEWWKKTSSELGPARKRGKISNLSLMYAMTLEGFLRDAAQKFDEHWSIEEAGQYFNGWFEAFPEIDLMNSIMAIQGITHDTSGHRLMGYRLKDEGKGNRRALTIFKTQTLSGRTIYAEGLNAGLNYGNQGTGADTLMRVMVELKLNHRPVFNCLINQVHDELVSMIPDNKLTEYMGIQEELLLKHASQMTHEYGVPVEATHTMGQVWIKD